MHLRGPSAAVNKTASFFMGESCSIVQKLLALYNSRTQVFSLPPQYTPLQRALSLCMEELFSREIPWA